MNTKANSKSFIKGAAALSISSLIVKIFGVMYKIPLARILLDEGMGYFNSAYTVYSFFFILCSAGVPKAITILISSSSKEVTGDEKSVLNTSILFFSFVGAILSLILIIFAAPISNLIGSKKIAYSMIAIAPAIPFIAAVSVLRGYLGGKFKFGYVAISQCIEAALKLLLGLAFAYIAIRSGRSTEIISAYAIAGITVGSVITFICLVATVKSKKISKKEGQSAVFSPSCLKKVCSISLPVTASAALMSLVNIIDLTVIMRGLKGLGYSEYVASILYGNYTTLSVPMFNFALSITTSICTSLLPILTENAIKENHLDFKEHLLKAGRLSAFVAAPATAVYMCLPKEALVILFETESVAIGAFLLSLLSISVILIAFLTVINTALESIGCYNIVLFSMLTGSAVKLASSYLLVGRADLGLWGAPLGTALSYTLSIVISLFAYKYNRLPNGILNCFIKSGVSAIISVFITTLLKRRLIFATLTPFTSFVILLIYGAIYLFCVISFSAISQKREFI